MDSKEGSSRRDGTYTHGPDNKVDPIAAIPGMEGRTGMVARPMDPSAGWVVKAYKGGRANNGEARRMKAEVDRVREMGKLSHVSRGCPDGTMPRLIDCGEARFAGGGESDLPALSMTEVRGVSLAGLLGGERATARQCLQILAAAVPVLEFLEAKSVSHGDLRPENVLVQTDGAGDIVGLGLVDVECSARYMGGVGGAEAIDAPMGDLRFISPETTCEGGRACTPYVYVPNDWSLGACLYWCLTGDYPAQGPEFETAVGSYFAAIHEGRAGDAGTTLEEIAGMKRTFDSTASIEALEGSGALDDDGYLAPLKAALAALMHSDAYDERPSAGDLRGFLPDGIRVPVPAARSTGDALAFSTAEGIADLLHAPVEASGSDTVAGYESYASRPDLERRVAEWVESNEAGLLLLVGGPGSGKSSVMAHMAGESGAVCFFAHADRPEASSLDALALCLAVRLAGDDAYRRALLAGMEACGTDGIVPPPGGSLFESLVLDVLAACGDERPHGPVFVDALDELDRGDAAAWLARLAGMVPVVVSCRDTTVELEDVREEADARSVCARELEVEDTRDVAAYVRERLGPGMLADLISRATGPSFSYAAFLCARVEAGDVSFGEDGSLAVPGTFSEGVGQSVRRACGGDDGVWRSNIAPALSALAHSPEPVPPETLRCAFGMERELRYAAFMGRAGQFLRIHRDGSLGPWHGSVGEALAALEGGWALTPPMESLGRLARWIREKYESGKELNRYELRNMGRLALASGDPAVSSAVIDGKYMARLAQAASGAIDGCDFVEAAFLADRAWEAAGFLLGQKPPALGGGDAEDAAIARWKALDRLGRLDDAVAFALAACERLTGVDGDGFQRAAQAVKARAAYTLMKQSRFGDASRVCEEVVGSGLADVATVVFAKTELANALRVGGRGGEGAAVIDGMLADENVLDVLESDAKLRLRTYVYLAYCLVSAGKPKRAHAELDKVEDVVQSAEEGGLDVDLRYVSKHHLVRACAYQGQGRFEESRPFAEEAYRTEIEKFGADSVETTNALALLGHCELRRGEAEAAVGTYGRCLEIRLGHYGEENAFVLNARRYLASAYLAMGRVGDAIDEYGRAVAVAEGMAMDGPSVGVYRCDLARTLARSGRADEAIANARAACRELLGYEWSGEPDPDAPGDVRTKTMGFSTAGICLHDADPGAAVEWYEAAIEVHRREGRGDDHPYVAELLEFRRKAQTGEGIWGSRLA